ncbi:MAG: F-box protein [Nostoc sp. DedQUE05]|uniref:F-box protein n=1 Tax=Nostoc sp. DedQUE05 TaxID=3075391 RepID=UPI002AD53F53|nr:F-box protein [Nostoc sp. DedQUE05]MDZ8096501.1 F-box protein [Nostoc sp. DedQUE05]
MKAHIVEQVEFFSEAELESLEFVSEELDAIEKERVPDLDSISFEEVAKELEAYFEGGVEQAGLEQHGGFTGVPELDMHVLESLDFNSLVRLRTTSTYLKTLVDNLAQNAKNLLLTKKLRFLGGITRQREIEQAGGDINNISAAKVLQLWKGGSITRT